MVEIFNFIPLLLEFFLRALFYNRQNENDDDNDNDNFHWLFSLSFHPFFPPKSGGYWLCSLWLAVLIISQSHIVSYFVHSGAQKHQR